MVRIHYASTKEADLFYLIRHAMADPFFFLDANNKRCIFLNSLELGAFRENNKNPLVEAWPLEPLLEKIRAQKGKGPVLGRLARLILQEHGKASEACVSRSLPLDIADYLRAQGVRLAILTSFVPERAIKTKTEVENLRESLKHTLSAFKAIEKILETAFIRGDSLWYEKEELTSEKLKEKVELILFKKGMECPEGLIISSGPQAAMPHHQGGGPLRPHQTVVCDIFPRSRVTRYFADMTRTYCKGKPSRQAARMYRAVRKSQKAALAAIKPGITGQAAHEAAAAVIKKAGFDTGERGFTHGLGHGLGLDVHEEPRLSPRSKDILKPGHVVTVEPGLYYPQWGGVRLEDVVLVTETGCENLAPYPRTFIIP